MIVRELSDRQECEYAEQEEKRKNTENRMKELDTLIEKLYETYALGKMPAKQYERLMGQYNAEYEELDQVLGELTPEGETADPKQSMDSFVAVAKKYADFEELTPLMINEFIDRIVVHEANGVRGFGRRQKIEIYFNFIGQFIPPYSEEELREEARAQEEQRAEKMRIRAEKRAATVKRYRAKRADRVDALKRDAEKGDPEAVVRYEEYLKTEAERREKSKAYFKERYRREREKYRKTKELAEKGDPEAKELLAEYDRRIEEKKKRAGEREKAKRGALNAAASGFPALLTGGGKGLQYLRDVTDGMEPLRENVRGKGF